MHQHDRVAGLTSKRGATGQHTQRGPMMSLPTVPTTPVHCKKMFFPKSNKLNRTYSVFIGQGHSQTLSLPLTAQYNVCIIKTQ